MKLLLDTHVLLWMLEKPEKLSASVRQVLESNAHEKYFSFVSLIELAVKKSIGKLETTLSVNELRRKRFHLA